MNRSKIARRRTGTRCVGRRCRILGREDIGTIEPGHIADIIIVGGNPAADILATRDVRLVIRDRMAYTIDELLVNAPPVQPAAGSR